MTGVIGLVAARIGSQDFAIDIGAVREIRGWAPPTPLARAPAYVQGMVDLRGVVIPIIDLAARLGLEPIAASRTSVIVVVQIRDRLAGLLVDSVSDLMNVDAARVQPTPDTGSREPHEVVRGIVEVEGRILSLISLDNVIPADLVPERLAS